MASQELTLPTVEPERPRWLEECTRCSRHYRKKNVFLKWMYNSVNIPSIALCGLTAIYGIQNDIPLVQNLGIATLVLMVVQRGTKLNEWSEICSMLSKGYGSLIKEYETHNEVVGEGEEAEHRRFVDKLKNRYLALEAQERVLPLDAISGIDLSSRKATGAVPQPPAQSQPQPQRTRTRIVYRQRDEPREDHSQSQPEPQTRGRRWSVGGWFRRRNRQEDDGVAIEIDDDYDDLELAVPKKPKKKSSSTSASTSKVRFADVEASEPPKSKKKSTSTKSASSTSKAASSTAKPSTTATATKKAPTVDSDDDSDDDAVDAVDVASKSSVDESDAETD